MADPSRRIRTDVVAFDAIAATSQDNTALIARDDVALRRGRTSHHVPRARLDQHTKRVRIGRGARRVRADPVRFHAVVVAAQRHRGTVLQRALTEID